MHSPSLSRSNIEMYFAIRCVHFQHSVNREQGYKVEFKRLTCEANLICNAQTLKEKKLFLFDHIHPCFHFPLINFKGLSSLTLPVL